MATEKGWFIKSKDPNDLYFTLRTEIDGTWTTNLDMALLFARKVDAESYYGNHFHASARDAYTVMGIQ